MHVDFLASSTLIHTKAKYSTSISVSCAVLFVSLLSVSPCLSCSGLRPSSRQGDVSGPEGFVDLGLHPGLPHHAGTKTGWEGREFCHHYTQNIIWYTCSSGSLSSVLGGSNELLKALKSISGVFIDRISF